jgi:hypothetical protein
LGKADKHQVLCTAIDTIHQLRKGQQTTTTPAIRVKVEHEQDDNAMVAARIDWSAFSATDLVAIQAQVALSLAVPTPPPTAPTIWTFCPAAAFLKTRVERKHPLPAVLVNNIHNVDGAKPDIKHKMREAVAKMLQPGSPGSGWLCKHPVVIEAMLREACGLPERASHVAMERFQVGPHDPRVALRNGMGVKVLADVEKQTPLAPYGGLVAVSDVDLQTDNERIKLQLARYAYGLPDTDGSALTVYGDAGAHINLMALLNDPTIDVVAHAASQGNRVAPANVKADVIWFRGLPYVWMSTTCAVRKNCELLLEYGLVEYWRCLLEQQRAADEQQQFVAMDSVLVQAFSGRCAQLPVTID